MANFDRIKFLTLLIVLLLHGCAPQMSGGLDRLDAVIVHNKTAIEVRDLKIKVAETSRVMSCSVVLANTRCSVALPETVDHGRPITVTWTQNNQTYRETLHGRNAVRPATDQPYQAVIDILDDGMIEVRLE